MHVVLCHYKNTLLLPRLVMLTTTGKSTQRTSGARLCHMLRRPCKCIGTQVLMACADQGRHMGGWAQQKSHSVLQRNWLPSEQMGGILCDADHYHLSLLHRHCPGGCHQHRPVLPGHPHHQEVSHCQHPAVQSVKSAFLDCITCLLRSSYMHPLQASTSIQLFMTVGCACLL